VIEIAPDARGLVTFFREIVNEGSCVFAIDGLKGTSPRKSTSLFQSRSTEVTNFGSPAFWWVFQYGV
jgi:hypothetical protein